MRDGRGLHMVDGKKKRTDEVREFIKNNPTALRKDICEALCMSPPTLRNHLKIINGG